MNTNPINPGLRFVLQQVGKLQWSPTYFIPSLLTGTVLILSLVVLLLLWPYGLLIILENVMRSLIVKTFNEMSELPLQEKISFVITMGIYVILWIPFFLIVSPLFALGGLGHLLATFGASVSEGNQDRLDNAIHRAEMAVFTAQAQMIHLHTTKIERQIHETERAIRDAKRHH